MIDRQQAELLAAVWARRDSQRLGHECSPTVTEFDLGFVVSSTVSTDVRAVPGDLPTTVIDKASGEVTTWPRVPTDVVEQMYRRSRPVQGPPPRTVDPSAQLLRELRRLPTPGVAAHLTVQDELFTAYGVKGDVDLDHHALVRSYLDGLPPGHLVRGGERHAEVIAVSDALHHHDHRRGLAGEPPLVQDEARLLFGSARFESYRIRETGDPAGGPAERPCDSCLAFLVHFDLLPWSELAFVEQWRPGPQVSPMPGRFPDPVADALVAAGWRPHFGDEVMAAATVEQVCAVRGATHGHVVLPAATRTLAAFPGLVGGRRGPGTEVWISRFGIHPQRVAHSADTLADAAAVIGARLFPIGSEQEDSLLAVDEHGRIFALDQAGEWFLGGDVDAALTTLLLGHAPARVRDDGTW
ncbi:SUKH-3 domain-containing protein [Micromonospora sp. NPDC000207]|uniref:SUKH-3 domain-containing protein n=1 Tax=Micromonospora sp. NPDC000207 TaxID=3154246 RepID=UPI0033286A23